jgi:uncharacterized protein (DUF488 family)
MTIYTIGHSTRTLDELITVLRAWTVQILVDVRTVPRSRTNPQFNADTLPAAMAGAGLGYTHLAALGGLRGRRKQAGPSCNTAWENTSFRNYADYAQTPAFAAGLADLLALADQAPCAIMCAEAVWWRCHRRIIADYLLARNLTVLHIMSATKIEPAHLTQFAEVQPDGTICYPGPAAPPGAYAAAASATPLPPGSDGAGAAPPAHESG